MPILEKLDSRLAGWKNLTLSRGGRLILLNSVLTGIPSFFCSAFRLPGWVSKHIDKIRRGFFWKGEKLKGGFHCLMKWGIVCRPRRLGGVGIRDLVAANSALLMKNLWTFFSAPLVPWAQFIWNKHYRLRPPSPTGKHPAGSSPIWKDMMKLSAPFFASVCFELGPGKIANFWSARWNGEFALKNCFPNLFTVSAATNASVSTWLHRFASSPWAAFPLPLTSAQSNEFRLLTEAIGSTELSNNRDAIIWRWTDKGVFTTRSAYLFLMDGGIKDGKNTFLWKTKTPLRVKLFLWLAAHNCLLTADNLAKRGWIGPSVCPLCSHSSENLEHILFDCTYALSLWSSFLDGGNAANRGSLASSGNLTARWQKLRSTSPPSSLRERSFFDIAFAACVWELWKERNARIFTNRQASIDILKGRVIATANLWALMIK